MKSEYPLILPLLLLLFLISCDIKPHPIAYGKDACQYCSMTIVDRQHAAQFVTTKGKPFKFDSIECMMKEINDGDYKPQLLLVTDYRQPGQLIDATRAIYLISEDIPSPMGANLSAFRTPDNQQEGMEDFEGRILTWSELKSNFQKQ